ncbi:MAG: leucyl aminopeptidase family protein [Betaproteobacteria bacterium]|nr:leucyl aminopeptidase family protein [Betaproteobacteria bacterium]
MLAKLTQSATPLGKAALDKSTHAVLVLPFAKKLDGLRGVPSLDRLRAALKRRDMQAEELAKTPVTVNLPEGGLCSFVMLDGGKSAFERQSVLRRAMAPLMEEQPRELVLALFGSAEARRENAREALYVAWVNGTRLPTRRKKPEPRPLARIRLYGARDDGGFAEIAAVAEANGLARALTALPPNELTPSIYRQRLRQLSRSRHWQFEEYDMRRLRRLGAGAFVAVAQGSAPEDAAIVHLSWRPKKPQGNLALVGKGICFDTGGHNLKPAKYMAGMHEDMNGSAVALGLMQALVERNVPLAIDAWLPIAQNHLSPEAYKQNDIITALDGTTIEVVHTDAEGRMVLADALTLATRGAGKGSAKPDLVIDFATLTGSMGYALGSRYSGVFATTTELARLAVAAGEASGERVCIFPLDADYEAGLESKVADIKQCTLDGEADHILAARFLKRFTGEAAWLHMDLSASSSSGGLGAVGTDLTGFGIAWGVEFVEQWLATHAASPAPRRRGGK